MHLLIYSSPAFNYGWLMLAAFLGGIINAVAGGGGFVVFPSLLHIGIPPVQSNATNTVALWPGQLFSIAGYRKDAKENLRLILPCMIAAVIGGLAGAWVLLHTSQEAFFRLIPWLFLLGAITFSISGPVGRWLARRREMQTGDTKVSVLWLGVMLTCVSFYIGYFGAGAGLMTMTVLSLFGVARLAEINALKAITTTTSNGMAVITFIVGGAVAWHYCAAMMAASAVGGYFGAHHSRKMNDKALRPVIIAYGFLLSAYFFWRQH